MGIFQEFRKFAVKGNVIDLAVGVIIGAAFGKITSSLVEHIITPLLSPLLGRVNFSQLYINLSSRDFATLDEALKAGVPIVRYGEFLNNVINFIIVAFAIFLVVRQINRLREQPKPAPAAPPAPTTKDCPFCVMPIPIPATRCGHCTSQLT